MVSYTLTDIQHKIDSIGYSYNEYLDSTVKLVIENLDKVVVDLNPVLGGPDATSGGGAHIPRHRVYDNTVARRDRGGGDRSYRKKSGQSPHDTIESWIAVRNFKPTKMEVKEGIEKNINEIRVVLNKITNKNYEAQMNTVLGLIEKNIESMDGEQDVEGVTTTSMMEKIGNFIFEISSTNKFYSEMYADLYKVLVEKYSVFSVILHSYLESYKSVVMLPFVDSSVNYDAYCEYTRSNERRRAAIHFFILLMKRNVLEVDCMLELARNYLNVVQQTMENAENGNQIDEYTELIFIIMTVGKDKFIGNLVFDGLRGELEVISGYKMKEKVGITSRSLFKYRDLVKAIK